MKVRVVQDVIAEPFVFWKLGALCMLQETGEHHELLRMAQCGDGIVFAFRRD